MPRPLRFYVLVLPNLPWPDLAARFQEVESLGFDTVGMADHFVDWANPASHWYELWTHVAAVAALTARIRIRTCVAQIPLRDPATLAKQALAVDHISGGRLDLGIGIGLPIDPSYGMMGIANWTNQERVARLGEYLEVVDRVLSNEVSSYQGRYYSIDGAVTSPLPIQRPRPPIMLAAMGPVMLKRTARYADIWNSMSFAEDFEAQLAETRDRCEQIDRCCDAIGRDPATLVRSYHMFDPGSRASGGAIDYYASGDAFAERVRRVVELGISDIGLYYPMLPGQHAAFERIAAETIPALRGEFTAVG